MFSARLPSVPELLFGSSSFASIGRAIIWTSISKWGYLGCAAWAKAADSSRYPNTLFSAYRHLKDSADDKKPTIADYCLTFSTRCNASSCAISMPAEVFVLTLCSDDMLHCGPDQHNHPCLATSSHIFTRGHVITDDYGTWTKLWREASPAPVEWPSP